MSFIKRFMSICLVCLLVFTNCDFQVFAGNSTPVSDSTDAGGGTSNTVRAELLAYAMTGSSTDIIKNLTSDDLVVFGMFMSNYTQLMAPFIADSDIKSSTPSAAPSASPTASASTPDTSPATPVASADTPTVNDASTNIVNLQAIAKILFSKQGTDEKQVNNLIGAYVYAIMHNSTALKDSSGNALTLYGLYNSTDIGVLQPYVDKIRLSLAMMMAADTKDYTPTVIDNEKNDTIYLSPFGDILLANGSGTPTSYKMLLPACVNPAMFATAEAPTGKINIINKYFLQSGMVQTPSNKVVVDGGNTVTDFINSPQTFLKANMSNNIEMNVLSFYKKRQDIMSFTTGTNGTAPNGLSGAAVIHQSSKPSFSYTELCNWMNNTSTVGAENIAIFRLKKDYVSAYTDKTGPFGWFTTDTATSTFLRSLLSNGKIVLSTADINTSFAINKSVEDTSNIASTDVTSNFTPLDIFQSGPQIPNNLVCIKNLFTGSSDGATTDISNTVPSDTARPVLLTSKDETKDVFYKVAQPDVLSKLPGWNQADMLDLGFGNDFSTSWVMSQSSSYKYSYGSAHSVLLSPAQVLVNSSFKQLGLNPSVAWSLSLGSTSVGMYAPEIYMTYWNAYEQMTDKTWLPKLDLPSIQANAADTAAQLNTNTSSAATARARQQKIDTILDEVHAFMSPDIGSNTYRRNWISAVLADFFLDTHNKIVQVDDGANATAVGGTGASKYSGYSGYVTTPRLSDVPWTSWIVSNYDLIYLVMLIFLTALALILWIAGKSTLMGTLKAIVLTAIVLLFPIKLMDLSIDGANAVNNSIYGSRFNFWAIIRMEQVNKEVATASVNPEDTLLTAVSVKDSTYYARDGGISLKWMMPKMQSAYDTGLLQGTQTSAKNDNLTPQLGLYKWLFAGFYNDETFTQNPMDLYLYRGMTDIVKTADVYYLAERDKVTGGVIPVTGLPDVKGTWGPNTASKVYTGSPFGTSSTLATDGYSFYSIIDAVNKSDTSNIDTTGNGKITTIRSFHGIAPLTDSGINSELTAHQTITNGVRDDNDLAIQNLQLQTKDIVDNDKQGYYLYAESPFYYFYYALRDIGAGSSVVAAGDTDVGNLKSLLVNDSFFHTANHGDLRDILDMEGLFKQIMPVLKAGTGRAKTSLAAVEKGSIDGHYPDGSPVQTASSWAMYSAWVDTIYDTGLATNDYANYLGARTSIGDGLDPNLYPKLLGRDMCFSEAQMHQMGLKITDLTRTESKILNVEKKTATDMKYLLNYVNFSDTTLTSITALIATFNFDCEFSEYNILKDAHVLYPQSYELKNFSYDAFMRLILLNNTGDATFSDTGMYAQMLMNTSVFTGVALVLNDVIATYFISGLKMFILILALLLIIILLVNMLFVTSHIVEMMINVTVVPLFQLFLAVTIHALLVSLFMGDGLTSIVGSRHISIVTNDPTVTLLALLVLNTALMIVLGLIFLNLFRMLRQHGKSIITSIENVTRKAVTNVTDTVGGGNAITVKATGKATIKRDTPKVPLAKQLHREFKRERRVAHRDVKHMSNIHDLQEQSLRKALMQGETKLKESNYSEGSRGANTLKMNTEHHHHNTPSMQGANRNVPSSEIKSKATDSSGIAEARKKVLAPQQESVKATSGVGVAKPVSTENHSVVKRNSSDLSGNANSLVKTRDTSKKG